MREPDTARGTLLGIAAIIIAKPVTEAEWADAINQAWGEQDFPWRMVRVQ